MSYNTQSEKYQAMLKAKANKREEERIARALSGQNFKQRPNQLCLKSPEKMEYWYGEKT